MKIPPRDTPIKSIYACDEAVGFIGACVKVRPTKKEVADLPVESVVKKLKDKALARSVRPAEDAYSRADAVGRPLEDGVAFLDGSTQADAPDGIGLWLTQRVPRSPSGRRALSLTFRNAASAFGDQEDGA